MDWVKDKKLDSLQLGRCIDTKATEAEVNRTMEMGNSLDISATPTLFVNGRRLAGAVEWPDLKRVIEFEIGYQKTAKNAGEDCGCSIALPMPPGIKKE
jgi:hypothetical protein